MYIVMFMFSSYKFVYLLELCRGIIIANIIHPYVYSLVENSITYMLENFNWTKIWHGIWQTC